MDRSCAPTLQAKCLTFDVQASSCSPHQTVSRSTSFQHPNSRSIIRSGHISTMATEQKKWSGSVTEVISAPVDKVWAILSDFDGLAGNFPEIFVSTETTEGEKNKVGSVRTVRAYQPDGQIAEATERLLVLDNEKHTLTYNLENHAVFSGFKAVVLAEKQGDDKTSVLWKFEVLPNAVLTEEVFVSTATGFIRSILVSLEKKLSPSTN